MNTNTKPKQRPELGAIVARHRARLGLSLRDVADMLSAEGCNKTRGAIHHYERGGGMRREVARALVNVLGLTDAQAHELYTAAGFVVALDGGSNV